MSKKQKRIEGIIKAHSVQLYRHAYWLTGNLCIAEDLVHQTLVRAWRTLDTLKDPNRTKYWLVSILQRENARRFEKTIFYRVDQEVDTFGNNQVEIDTSSQVHFLRMALERLAVEYQEPLLLQVIWGFNSKEIAKQLNISPSVVMTRLFSAKKTLRQQIAAEEVDKK